MTALSDDRIAEYRANGFVWPIRVFSEAEAKDYRRLMECAEASASAGSERAARANLPITHAWAWDLAREPRVIGPVASLLGPNLLLWSMDWFIKEPGGADFVSYHQDATYWGLAPHHVASAWIALSDAAANTGPMRFLPGSHLGPVARQNDTYAKDNLLSRGQVVTIPVDESKTVLTPLAIGEMSIHHVRVVHGSQPNLGRDRRVGMVLRYCATDVRQTKAETDHAVLAAGEDAYGHFDLVPRPRTDMGEAEQQLARRHARNRYRVLMED